MNKQFSSDVVTLSSNEKVVVLHEDEAGVVYSLIQEYLKLKTLDITDEEDWSLILYFKSLQEKLRQYLDGK
jgi:hypothetical protein